MTKYQVDNILVYNDCGLFSVFIVLKIELTRACAAGDQCKDDFAACITNKCLCLDTHFDKNRICGKQFPLLKSFKLLIHS